MTSVLKCCWQDFLLLVCGPKGESDRPLLLARLAIMLFIVVLPFQHNAAWKYLSQVGMLVSIAILLFQKRLFIDLRSPIWWALWGLLGILCLTAILGTTPLDSFNELRKHFMPGILLLILVPVVFSEPRLIRQVLVLCATVFVLRAVLALAELIQYLPDLNAAREGGRFIKGFALDAGFYIPILLGLLLLGRFSRCLAVLGLPLVLTVMLLVQSRAPIFAAVIALGIMLVFLRRWRILAISSLLGLALVGFVVTTQPAIGARLASAFDIQTYSNLFRSTNVGVPDDGLSGRTTIWKGVLEITESRYWQGYGFGWKKLGQTAVEQGYVAKWQSSGDAEGMKERAWYFALPSDKVNPHNLYLQIYFESGILGVIAYLLSVSLLFWVAACLVLRSSGEKQIVAAIFMAYLVDHLVLGFANGLWLGQGTSFVLLALLEAVRRDDISR